MYGNTFSFLLEGPLYDDVPAAPSTNQSLNQAFVGNGPLVADEMVADGIGTSGFAYVGKTLVDGADVDIGVENAITITSYATRDQ